MQRRYASPDQLASLPPRDNPPNKWYYTLGGEIARQQRQGLRRDTEPTKLTHTFRCGPRIADVANGAPPHRLSRAAARRAPALRALAATH